MPHPVYVEIKGESDWAWKSFVMQSCDATDQVACTAAAFGWHGFEAPMPTYFAIAVRRARERLIVDVGANTGFYTLLAMAVSHSVSVVAYEPLPEVCSIMSTNMSLNPSRAGTKLFPYAITDVSGERTLYVPNSPHGLVETSASLLADFKTTSQSSRQVEAYALDVLHADSKPIGIIKVDAEGHDLAVLHGAANILARDKPVIFIEVLLGSDEQALTELLIRLGYRDFVLRSDMALRSTKVVKHDTLAWNHMWVHEDDYHEYEGLDLHQRAALAAAPHETNRMPELFTRALSRLRGLRK